MQSRSHSLSGHSTFHFALIAFVCVLMGLLSSGSPAPLAGTDSPTRQIDDSVEQFAALDHTAVPMVSLDIRFAEDLPYKWVEPADPMDDDETDEDETEKYILRSGLAAFGSPTGLYLSSADRAALTPFRLLGFSSRGSPSA